MPKANKKPVSGTGRASNSKTDRKQNDLAPDIETGANEFMTTDQGLKINDDQNSLKSGERGATLLEDFILREKITHFDHERIPERIVHARGAAAHGYFQVYKPMANYTKAGFLNNPAYKDTRICPVLNSRGIPGIYRSRARCARLLGKILHRRREL